MSELVTICNHLFIANAPSFATRYGNGVNAKKKLQQPLFRSTAALVMAAGLLSACAALKPVDSPPPPRPRADQPTVSEPLPAPKTIDPMAEVPGEMPLPLALQGEIERIDCTSGKPDWHARIAFEAQGGQVLNFAYYSRWKPRTCSLEVTRDAADTKWRVTPDGAVRVHTPQGRFLIRTSLDAYVFQFENVRRQQFCGMPGEINGTMTVKRRPGKPECSAAGIMDTNDAYLDRLYKRK